MSDLYPAAVKGELDGSLAFSQMPYLGKKDVSPHFRSDPQWGLKGEVLRLQEKLEKYFSLKAGSLCFSASAMDGDMAVMESFLSSGDEAIVEFPTYDPLISQVEYLGARPVLWTRNWKNKFRLDITALKKLINKKTKLIVLTNGHNPSGMKLEREDLMALKKVAQEKQIPVLFDEVFLPAAVGPREPYSATYSKWFISVGSVDKSFCLGPLRIGWIVATPRLVKKFKVHSFLCNNLSQPSLQLLDHFMGRFEKIRLSSQQTNRENLDVMEKWVNSRDDVQWLRPTCGNICFPRFKKINVNKLSQWLMEKHNMIFVAGRFFNHPKHARISTVCSKRKLQLGLRKISEGIDHIT